MSSTMYSWKILKSYVRFWAVLCFLLYSNRYIKETFSSITYSSLYVAENSSLNAVVFFGSYLWDWWIYCYNFCRFFIISLINEKHSLFQIHKSCLVVLFVFPFIETDYYQAICIQVETRFHKNNSNDSIKLMFKSMEAVNWRYFLPFLKSYPKIRTIFNCKEVFVR